MIAPEEVSPEEVSPEEVSPEEVSPKEVSLEKVSLEKVSLSSNTRICCGTIYIPPYTERDPYDSQHDQTDPDSWSTADTLNVERAALQQIKDAGGEMDYQVIPEKMVEGNIRKKRVVIRLFTETCHLPAIKRAVESLQIYLQDPKDLSVDCPYYNFQLLHFGPRNVVKSNYIGSDNREYCRDIHLPNEVVAEME